MMNETPDAEKKACCCPYCEGATSMLFPFCQSCGMEFKLCPECKRPIRPGVKECPHCHKKLD